MLYYAENSEKGTQHHARNKICDKSSFNLVSGMGKVFAISVL